MSNRQIIALFVCSLVPFTVGNGLVPLLPIYAAQLGAEPASAGNYLAFSYLAIAICATVWIGGVLGFAGTGYAFQNLGVLPTFIIAISLPLTAIAFLTLIRSEQQEIRP